MWSADEPTGRVDIENCIKQVTPVRVRVHTAYRRLEARRWSYPVSRSWTALNR